jgi:hypothetical protein
VRSCGYARETFGYSFRVRFLIPSDVILIIFVKEAKLKTIHAKKIYTSFFFWKIRMPRVRSWIGQNLCVTQLWLVLRDPALIGFGKKSWSWSVCDHVCIKNTSSVTGLFVLQIQWLKCTNVTSLVATRAIYSKYLDICMKAVTIN